MNNGYDIVLFAAWVWEVGGLGSLRWSRSYFNAHKIIISVFTDSVVLHTVRGFCGLARGFRSP